MEKKKELLGKIVKEKSSVQKKEAARKKECALREVAQDLMAKEVIQRKGCVLQMTFSLIIKYQKLWNRKFTL